MLMFNLSHFLKHNTKCAQKHILPTHLGIVIINNVYTTTNLYWNINYKKKKKLTLTIEPQKLSAFAQALKTQWNQ